MGKIILNSCGKEKVQVIRIVQSVTGLGLKEAKDAVDAVESGESFLMEVPEGTENSIVGQFAAVGAEAFKETGRFENSKEAGEENLSSAAMVEVGDPNLLNRDETLSILYEAGRIAEQMEALNAEAASLPNDIAIRKQKAEEMRHVVSGKATAIKWAAILCSLLTWKLIPVVITIIVWIVMNQTVIKKDLREHEEENNANAQRYTVENVAPLVERQKKVAEEIAELNSSDRIAWAKNIVGERLFHSSCIGDLYDLVKERRADNLKEAINLYEDIQYKARMEERQAAIQNASEISAAEAVKQTAYSKMIAKSSHQTATAAKATAYHTRQMTHRTRKFR